MEIRNVVHQDYPRLFYSLRDTGLIVGKTYTLSYKARVEGKNKTLGVWIGYQNGTQLSLKSSVRYTSDWEKYQFTFELKYPIDDVTRLMFWINSHNAEDVNKLFIKEVKLEEGTILHRGHRYVRRSEIRSKSRRKREKQKQGSCAAIWVMQIS